MQCGLLGRKLGHSYSPEIHGLLGDYDYLLYEKEPEELESFLQSGEFRGLNVTIPYKKAVLPYLDQLTPIAGKLGNVNTVLRLGDGRLLGHNTDYDGFLAMINRSKLAVSGKKALVLGSGGASKTATAVLRELGANVVVISRTGPDNYGNLSRHADAAILVNATPVGMFPDVARSPVDLRQFPNLKGVLDLIYNPARTRLLLDAEALGIPGWNGLYMLVAQAWESARWFTGKDIPGSKIGEIYRTLKNEMENILLIGMPGCGKTTVGRALAERLGRKFVDADEELERIYGISISDFLKNQGEPAFRALETSVLGELGKQSGLIIATGGGCVTVPENYDLLHQNGRIFWIDRELSALSTENRPLSQNQGVSALFDKRRGLYEVFSDFTVCNNGPVLDTVNSILEVGK